MNSILQVVGQFYALMRNPGDAEKIKEELHKHLQVFEDELKDKFFTGKIAWLPQRRVIFLSLNLTCKMYHYVVKLSIVLIGFVFNCNVGDFFCPYCVALPRPLLKVNVKYDVAIDESPLLFHAFSVKKIVFQIHPE